MYTVNWTEVVQKAAGSQNEAAEIRGDLASLGLVLEPFSVSQAGIAGSLREPTMEFGLSLGRPGVPRPRDREGRDNPDRGPGLGAAPPRGRDRSDPIADEGAELHLSGRRGRPARAGHDGVRRGRSERAGHRARCAPAPPRRGRRGHLDPVDCAGPQPLRLLLPARRGTGDRVLHHPGDPASYRAGRIDFVPCQLRAVADLLGDGLDLDLAILSVSAPRDGTPAKDAADFGAGLNCDFVDVVVDRARRVVAEVNSALPDPPDGPRIAARDIDCAVPVRRPRTRSPFPSRTRPPAPSPATSPGSSATATPSRPGSAPSPTRYSGRFARRTTSGSTPAS